MNSRHDAETGLIRDMVLQAKDAVEVRLGDTYPLRKFLFELDEFEMREFLWLYRKSLTKDVEQQMVEQWNKESTPTRASQLKCSTPRCADNFVCENHEILEEVESKLRALVMKEERSACCCVAGLPDPECAEHGMHSKQADVFYAEGELTRLRGLLSDALVIFSNEKIGGDTVAAIKKALAPWIGQQTQKKGYSEFEVTPPEWSKKP